MEHAVTVGMVVYTVLGIIGVAGLFAIAVGILASYASSFNL